jgi:hypothetical protein
MWRRPSALAWCVTLALRGDVCGSLPTGPPDVSSYTDAPRPLSFRLSVQPGGPAFRITVRPHLVKVTNDLVPAGDIEVARCSDGRRLQLLTIMASQPINFPATFTTSDVNFDGYLDFSVLAEFGGTFGAQSWWIYDPAGGRFVQNELTRELRKLGNNGYHIDPKKHEIIIENLLAVCPSLIDRYRLEGDRLVLIHHETGFQNSETVCTVTYSDRDDGTMHRTAQRRFKDGKPVK